MEKNNAPKPEDYGATHQEGSDIENQKLPDYYAGLVDQIKAYHSNLNAGELQKLREHTIIDALEKISNPSYHYVPTSMQHYIYDLKKLDIDPGPAFELQYNGLIRWLEESIENYATSGKPEILHSALGHEAADIIPGTGREDRGTHALYEPFCRTMHKYLMHIGNLRPAEAAAEGFGDETEAERLKKERMELGRQKRLTENQFELTEKADMQKIIEQLNEFLELAKAHPCATMNVDETRAAEQARLLAELKKVAPYLDLD